jgi:hypothetical protein
MEYILLDNFNGNINVVSNEDGSGELMIIDNLKEAEEKLPDYCQDGQIIPLGIDMIYLIKELVNAVDDKTKIIHIGDLVTNVLDKDLQFP